jgi:hypothetical protein
MFPDEPIKLIALVVVLIGVVLLIGSALCLFLPPREEAAGGGADGRIAPRHRVLKSARIQFGGIEVDCVVRNISQTGAAIEVASLTQCPIAFILSIPSDGSARHCRVVWRRGKRMGVKFN